MTGDATATMFQLSTISRNYTRFTDAVMTVYAEAYMDAPFFVDAADVTYFAQRRWPHLIARDGFRLVIGWADTEPAGMAFGISTDPRDETTSNLAQQLGPRASEWLTDSFQMLDLAVRPEFHRAGLGSRLHDRLLDQTDHSTALLYALAADNPARTLYLRKGWTILADGIRQLSERDYCLMGKRLR